MSKKFVYMSEMTPDMVYEKDYSIPSGWEAIDFRPPAAGDSFLGGFYTTPFFRSVEYHTWDTWSSPQTPRLILKKSQQTVNPNLGVSISIGDVYGPETIILPEGWKFERFGMPKNGEMVLSRYYKTHSSQKPVYEFYTNTHPHDILPRIIVTKA